MINLHFPKEGFEGTLERKGGYPKIVGRIMERKGRDMRTYSVEIFKNIGVIDFDKYRIIVEPTQTGYRTALLKGEKLAGSEKIIRDFLRDILHAEKRPYYLTLPIDGIVVATPCKPDEDEIKTLTYYYRRSQEKKAIYNNLVRLIKKLNTESLLKSLDEF